MGVITSLALDHQEVLGETIREIALAKLGIVNPGCKVVFRDPNETPHLASEILNAIQETKQQVSATWIAASSFPHQTMQTPFGPRWLIKTPWGTTTLGVMGHRSATNASIALHALIASGDLPTPDSSMVAKVFSAFEQTKWPCRMELFIIEGKKVYLSGDHNPHGAESLHEIVSMFDYENLHLLVGLTSSKLTKKNEEPSDQGLNADWQLGHEGPLPARDEMLRLFSSLPRCRLTLTLTPFRKGSLDQYGRWLTSAEGGAHEDPEVALERCLKQASANDLIIVTGSLYLAGYLRQKILNGRFGKYGEE
jgi:folylpolyglutamate synthase/dihydropteroate synthase